MVTAPSAPVTYGLLAVTAAVADFDFSTAIFGLLSLLALYLEERPA